MCHSRMVTLGTRKGRWKAPRFVPGEEVGRVKSCERKRIIKGRLVMLGKKDEAEMLVRLCMILSHTETNACPIKIPFLFVGNSTQGSIYWIQFKKGNYWRGCRTIHLTLNWSWFYSDIRWIRLFVAECWVEAWLDDDFYNNDESHKVE